MAGFGKLVDWVLWPEWGGGRLFAEAIHANNVMMLFEIITIGLAALLIIMPDGLLTRAKKRHAERLAELDAGAPEIYFEERRALETYPPVSSNWTYRLFGAAALILYIFYLSFCR